MAVLGRQLPRPAQADVDRRHSPGEQESLPLAELADLRRAQRRLAALIPTATVPACTVGVLAR